MKLQYTVYTKPKCSYCDKVKELLKDVDPTPNWIDASKYLESEHSKQFFLNFIKDTANLAEPYKTFPIVFCNNEFIGGYTETKQFHENQFKLNEEF
jgi:glutaredoxin